MTTPGAHECSFPIQPPDGSMTAPGPCECGKSWKRSKAELLLAEASAAMKATEPGVLSADLRETPVPE